jgi:hypothetical protein
MHAAVGAAVALCCHMRPTVTPGLRGQVDGSTSEGDVADHHGYILYSVACICYHCVWCLQPDAALVPAACSSCTVPIRIAAALNNYTLLMSIV